MPLRASATDRPLDLPPLFSLLTLRERGDAFDHARQVAAEKGAGALVWVRRFDLAEFAVVLEPDEPLQSARRGFYPAMNALGSALAAHAPPERPLTFQWPDAIHIDGVLVGGGRLGWPDGAADDETPDWLVFGAMVRTFVVRAGDPGLRPLFGSLEELGFENVDAAAILESFARTLMAALHDWREDGFGAASRTFLARAEAEPGTVLALDADGSLLVKRGDKGQVPERRELKQALLQPSWRDPKTGAPWL